MSDISFWCLIKLNDRAFQWKKNEILQLTRSKFMVLKNERETAADREVWLTHLSHLKWVLDSQKRN